MLITKKNINSMLRKIILESTKAQSTTISVDGKSFIIVNDLEHFTKMVELITQGYRGSSTGFGNYFELVVKDVEPVALKELNDRGSPFPFADIYSENRVDVGCDNVLYSVKMKRVVDDTALGGGEINRSQIRSLLQHPTTVQEFIGKTIKLGLISGQFEPEVYKQVKNLGIPLKIVKIDPTGGTPSFKRIKSTVKPDQDILCIKTNDIEYATNCLGAGAPISTSIIELEDDYKKYGIFKNQNQPGQFFDKNILTKNNKTGWYEINASDEIFKISEDDDRIFQSDKFKSAVNQYNTVSAIAGQDADIIKAFYNKIGKVQSQVKASLEKQYTNQKKTVSSYDKFIETINNNIAIKNEPYYIILTGGFTNSDMQNMQTVFENLKEPPLNLKSEIAKVDHLVKIAYEVAKKPSTVKSIAVRLINSFGKSQLVKLSKSYKSKLFPDGFFMILDQNDHLRFYTGKNVTTKAMIPDTNLGISQKLYVKNVKFSEKIDTELIKQNIKTFQLATTEEKEKFPKELQKAMNDSSFTYIEPISRAMSNKGIETENLPFSTLADPKALKKAQTLGKIDNSDIAKMKEVLKILALISISEFNAGIDEFAIPIAKIAKTHDVEAFKKQLREFQLLKNITDASKTTGLYTQDELNNAQDAIDRFRNENVLPLANLVLPKSISNKMGTFTKNDIKRQLGIIKESILEHSMADPGNFVIMVINLAILFDEIFAIASQNVDLATEMVIQYNQAGTPQHFEKEMYFENKRYQKILSVLLKHSRV
jgi:hypothetical protein